MAERIILKNARIFNSCSTIEYGWLVLENNLIISINEGDFINQQAKNSTIIDCSNKTIIPGFIDIHVHGGYGYDFSNDKVPLKATLDNFAQKVLAEGVTSFCAATVSAKKITIDNFCQQLGHYIKQKQPYAQVLGAYLESPFISKEYKGAHDVDLLSKPDCAWIKNWKKISNNKIKFVAYAPELDEGFTNFLIKEKIIPSFAHSNANYWQTKKALLNGINHVTHFYNAMTGFSHRNPGAVPAILFDDNVSVELICDGIHVDDEILKLTYKIKGANKIIAISDAVSPKGCLDGTYPLASLPIVKVGNKITLKASKTISGSATTMIDNFNKLLIITNNNWNDCIKMTAWNAAQKLKEDLIGDIKVNNFADLLVLDQNNDIFITINKGNIIYNSKFKNN